MSDASPRPSCAELFAGFFSAGVMGFGGVLPWTRRMVVERRRWLTAAEFADVLGLCQFLPGGNVMNVSIALGARFRGVPGALSAFLGLMCGPVAIVVGLGAVYAQFKDDPVVARAFAFLGAAAAAYMVATALRIAQPLLGRPVPMAVAAATVAAVAWWNAPLLIALPILAGVSVALMARFRA